MCAKDFSSFQEINPDHRRRCMVLTPPQISQICDCKTGCCDAATQYQWFLQIMGQ